jgi:hypothetical protein
MTPPRTLALAASNTPTKIRMIPAGAEITGTTPWPIGPTV